MQTTIINLSGVRGDTLVRTFPLEVAGTPMSEADAAALAAQFTQRAVQVRDVPGGTILASGYVDILTSPPAIVIELPARDMQDVLKASYDLQLTDPRDGNPRGPLVWTVIAGKLNLRADVTVVPGA